MYIRSQEDPEQDQPQPKLKTVEMPGMEAPADEPAAPAEAPEDYTALGKYANNLGAWNGNEKFNKSWDDRSERYKMLTVMSHFNPNEGITPAMIDALNKANIHGAKFSGSRDKLTVDNAGGWDRFGTGGTGDVIQGFNDPNNKNKQWGAWQVDDGASKAVPGGSMIQGMVSNPYGEPMMDTLGRYRYNLPDVQLPTDYIPQG